MAAPPRSLASQRRMNPAGIAYLYGALDADTATAEVYDGRPHVAVAGLRTLIPCRVVDLTRIENPSAFDPDVTYEHFTGTAFLQDFRYDIARPIVSDDRVHHEYIPTQSSPSTSDGGFPPGRSTASSTRAPGLAATTSFSSWDRTAASPTTNSEPTRPGRRIRS